MYRVLFYLSLVGAILNTAPHAKAAAMLETPNYIVQSERQEESWEEVTITGRQDQKSFSFRRLAAGTVERAYEAPDKLAIVYRFKSERDNEITIIDTCKNAVLDVIRCFTYASSPNGTFLVYERYQPRFMPAQDYRPAIMLLDLSKYVLSPELFYPETEDETQLPNGNVNFPISPFLWSTDEGRLVYLNRVSAYGTWDDYEAQLVVGSYTKQSEEWDVNAVVLDKLNFFKDDTEPDAARLLVANMEWKKPNEIRITKYPGIAMPNLLSSSFIITLDGKIEACASNTQDHLRPCR